MTAPSRWARLRDGLIDFLAAPETAHLELVLRRALWTAEARVQRAEIRAEAAERRAEAAERRAEAAERARGPA